MRKVEGDHPLYSVEWDLREIVGKRSQPVEDAQKFEHSAINMRAALLALAKRLRVDLPLVSDILQTHCISGMDALIADLYTHLAAFPRSFELPTKDKAALPVCAHCGEMLDSGVVASPGSQYHGRCLREAYRLGTADLYDPESI